MRSKYEITSLSYERSCHLTLIDVQDRYNNDDRRIEYASFNLKDYCGARLFA